MKSITAMKSFNLLSMNFIRLFNITKAKNQYILNMIDYFFRFIILTSLLSASIREMITLLRRTFLRFLRSAAIYLNIRTHFNNKIMKNYCKETKITMKFAPAAAHKSVSIIERLNKILQQAFKRIMFLTLK